MASRTSDLSSIEAEIDEAFSNHPLARLPFAQAVWTLLSVVEDHYFKISVYDPLPAIEAAIYVDGLMNALTHPLRVCFGETDKSDVVFKRELCDEHYAQADDWLDLAEKYDWFCSIFPLYHAKQIELRVEGKELIPSSWAANELAYEVYDRFVQKRDPAREKALNADSIVGELNAAMSVSGGSYSIAFTRRLMSQLEASFGPTWAVRHELPEDWQFSCFTLGQYRKVCTCLQSMAYAWFVARQIVAGNGAPALAFASALWTPRRGLLVATIARQTGVQRSVVSEIVRYLTFGEVGIRNPDIAIQPLVDLLNGQLAISAFVLTNMNAERNLCVLLNQIPVERGRYSALVDEKEHQVRSAVMGSLSGLSLDFKHGRIDDTDVDLAVIDRTNRVCLCIEIKWFIEPAEIREVVARSEELAKGVVQAKKIIDAFGARNGRLFELLGIDETYEFLAVVGSVNFIGRHAVQHEDVPIVRLWHLASELRRRGNLRDVLGWLRSRSYLPNERDFSIRPFSFEVGGWRSSWYGISYGGQTAEQPN